LKESQKNEIAKLVEKHKRDMLFNCQASRHQYENLCAVMKMKESENSMFRSLMHMNDKLRKKSGTDDSHMSVKNPSCIFNKDSENTKLKKEIDVLKQNRMMCITDMISKSLRELRELKVLPCDFNLKEKNIIKHIFEVRLQDMFDWDNKMHEQYIIYKHN